MCLAAEPAEHEQSKAGERVEMERRNTRPTPCPELGQIQSGEDLPEGGHPLPRNGYGENDEACRSPRQGKRDKEEK